MKQEHLVGKVQTVLGLIEPESLGITLPHEHLLTDLWCYFAEPVEASEKKKAYEPVGLENLWWVKPHSLSSLDDLKMLDEQVAIKEAMMFKLAGGNSIVEMSNIGLCRDPLGLVRISRATGLNIVMGAGYYIAISHPPEVADMAEDEIVEGIVREVLEGVGDTGVCAGIIGEVGISVPMDETDPKMLRAVARAQRLTGAPVNIHPSIDDDLLLAIIEILRDAGVDLSRTVISHMDGFGFSPATRRKVAETGCYIEYDTFGHPDILTPLQGRIINMPSDTQRVTDIVELIGAGYLNQILVSQDHCFKHCWASYGGYGYAHILRDMAPVMRVKGITEEQIHTILVENPKRLLTFAPATAWGKSAG